MSSTQQAIEIYYGGSLVQVPVEILQQFKAAQGGLGLGPQEALRADATSNIASTVRLSALQRDVRATCALSEHREILTPEPSLFREDSST